MKLNLVILLIWIIIMIVLILKIWFEKDISDLENPQRPSKKTKSQLPSVNDKIVIVKYVELDYLTRAIHQFCNLYNQDKNVVIPKLVKQNYFYVITFPFNIEFDNFCSFVNYLGNPDDLCNFSDYQPNVKAWCTTNTKVSWLTENVINKKVMLSIPQSEIKHDWMYLATIDNLGYKFKFTPGDADCKLEPSLVRYENMPLDLAILSERKFIDFD